MEIYPSINVFGKELEMLGSRRVEVVENGYDPSDINDLNV